MKRFSTAAWITLFLIILTIGTASAQEVPGDFDQGPRDRSYDAPDAGPRFAPRHGPPPEFFRICEGKTAGAAVQVTAPDGALISGVCTTADARLVFRPDHPRRQFSGNRPTPPPEAYKACEGKSAGAPASLTGPQGETVTGTCEDMGGKLALRPDFLNREGRGQLPEQRNRDTRQK
jgi:hypothetical protein